MPVGGELTIWKTGSDAVPGTLDDYSTETKSVTPNFSGAKLDDTTFQAGAKQWLRTFTEGSFTVKYRYSAALALELLTQQFSGTPVDFEFAPNGDDTGQLKMAGSIFIETYSNPTAVEQVEDIDVTYSLTGTMTPELYT